MKHWVVIGFVLLAAAYARTRVVGANDTVVSHVQASLTAQDTEDGDPKDIPLFATAPTVHETMRTGGSGFSIGKAPKSDLAKEEYCLHHIFHSHTLCGHPDPSPGTFARASDHFIFEFRKIVI